ncbi:MAG: stage II sporulation protein P [Lachnospiraceae bacterium]|jgi:stage II sporulation protein P|nr:stage II sporulation protein P [Lachnospiraceae bacterium]
MNRKQKVMNGGVWLLILVLGVYILGYGVKGQPAKRAAYACAKLLSGVEFTLQKSAARLIFPGLLYSARETEQSEGMQDILTAWAWELFPIYEFVCGQELYETEIESGSIYDLLLARKSYEEDEQEEEPVETEQATEEPGDDLLAQMEAENQAVLEEQERIQQEQEEGTFPGVEYTEEQLSDFSFVRNNFYTIASNTDISAELLDAPTMSQIDLRLQNDASEPQILIYHTHSQEGFVDSVEGDLSTTIVGVGDYLTEILQNKYGYNVIHNTNVYDFRDGKLDRNQAYSLALPEIEAILEQYPSIEVVIDLHRDGVDESLHLVKEVNGKPTAQFMFFNGLSYSARNGPIEYLNNPYIEDNLAFSLQLKLASEKYYPGLARRIFLKSLRYNLHVRPKSVLVEAGAQTNTLEEMMNAMEPLADVLHQVLGDSGGTGE